MFSRRIEFLFLSVVFAGVFCFVSIAFAQQGSGSNPEIIGQWDKDKDGKVSKAEWQRSENLFTQYDKNNSGYIESDEKPQMPTTELMDANGDKKVSKDEFLGPADFFKQLDANSDGFLTDDENTIKSGAGGGAPAGGSQHK
jgi:Ca2+-binding EF-hand superfamily protein